MTNIDNLSSYIWEFQTPINHVVSIKLLAYSLPDARYNIEDKINNLFKFSINNIEKTILLPTGKYTIEDIINYINNELYLIDDIDNLKISMNIEQKLILETEHNNDIYIFPTHLSKYNLGFMNETNSLCKFIKPERSSGETISQRDIIKPERSSGETISQRDIIKPERSSGETISQRDIIKPERSSGETTCETNKIIADHTWDLRINDKVYLYINNLSDEIPFGILFYNGQSVSQFKFENSFELDKLEINFKNSYGYEINFYNLPHRLSFLVEKLNS